MERFICSKCGAPLEQQSENIFKCRHCGLSWREDTVRKEIEALRGILSEEKMERIANLKQQLWKENNRPYLDSKEIIRLCKEIKAYAPDDFYANFYAATNSDNENDFIAALNDIDVEERYDEIETLIDYCLRSITAKNMLAMCNLIERAYKTKDPATFGRIRTKYDKQAKCVDECVYDPRYPRNVFICYSSKDMPYVEELVEYFESNDLSCFVAVRNLQHGRAAKEKYWSEIHAAIENCECLVFLSSENSRDYRCDALDELRFMIQYNDNHPLTPKRKIEYLIDAYKGAPIEKVFARIFEGLEYCYDKETVLDRFYEYAFGVPEESTVEETPAEEETAVAEETVEEVAQAVDIGTVYDGGNRMELLKGQNLFLPTGTASARVVIENKHKAKGVKTDLYVFMLDNNEKVVSESDLVFSGNTCSSDKAVGLVENDDRNVVNISFENLSRDVSKIRFMMAPNMEDGRLRNCSMIQSSGITISIEKEAFTIQLSDFGRYESVLAIEFFRVRDRWKLSVQGVGLRENIEALCNRYGVDVG